MPPELTSFLDEANKVAGKYGTVLQVLFFPLIAAIIGGSKLFRDRQRNRPNLPPKKELVLVAEIVHGADRRLATVAQIVKPTRGGDRTPPKAAKMVARLKHDRNVLASILKHTAWTHCNGSIVPS